MATAIERAEASDPTLTVGQPRHDRLPMLDGWRAISILLVLAGHMLPLGPAAWGLNAPVAALGMAIFFTLSGFLIVSILLRDAHVGRFLVRRIARIVPLAWTMLAIVFVTTRADWRTVVANLFFYANLPPFPLDHTGHFWSLCVEMQFYAAIALVVLLFGRRGLFVVPFAALVVTATRVWLGATVSIVTWARVDEILAGGCLALAIHEAGVERCRAWTRRLPFLLVAGMFLLSTADMMPPLDYARPYLAATLVGLTIVRTVPLLSPILVSRPLGYVAKVSYAVYIIHPYLREGWLAEGAGVVRAARRLLSFALTFAIAHLSTFRFEAPINRWAHRISAAKAPKGRSGGSRPK